MLWRLAQQPGQQVLSTDVVVLVRELEFVVQNRLQDTVLVFQVVAERQSPCDELVADDAERPHVHLEAVSPALDELGREVVQRPGHRVGARVVLVQFLRDPEVHELQVSLRIEHHILRFEVSVDDSALMERFQDQRKGANIELRLLAAQHVHAPAVAIEELSACDELHQDINTGGCGEGLHHADHEGVVYLGEQGALPLDLLRHLALVLPHSLQGVLQLRAAVLHESDGPTSTDADDPLVAQVAQAHGWGVFERDPLCDHRQHAGRDDHAKPGLV
mmetsp:Transcript_52872/g.152397  ORF Transcript_52872/g.152397 Transcript_52872/m.152397 type:complete len:275 (-) Transcript_52872:1812-2636(-)